MLLALTDAHHKVLSAAMRSVGSTDELLRNLRSVMWSFPAIASQDAESAMDALFEQGFKAGATDAGASPDAGDQHALEWLKTNPIGFLSALSSFGQSESRWFEKNLAGKPLPEALALARRRGTDANYKLERIVRTDEQKATSLGRLLSWVDDPNRDYYNYGWFPLHDGREKDVSILFERRNPMTYWELRKTFEVDHVVPKLVINRHTGRKEAQVSAFNCRCEVARWPKPRWQLVRDGLISQTETAA